MSTLISFLGRQHKGAGGYRTACYRFDDGSERTVRFFGLALARHIRPERLIILGTAGSMWDVFFEEESNQNDDQLLELIDHVANQSVDDEMLHAHALSLSKQLGLQVECVLIDQARDSRTQASILDALARRLEVGEHVVLDVTHSFRHLPMLALVAARYLKHIQNIQVNDIYYGALEMTVPPSPTPVLRLGGMLEMLDWVEAFSAYEKDGDYSIFSDLLERDGLDVAPVRELSRAAFQERAGFTEGARQKLAPSLEQIDQHDGALGRLFIPELKRRIEWVRQPERYRRELSLARAYFDRRDYLRAVTLLFEGIKTREVFRRKGDHNDHAQRDEAARSVAEDNPRFRKLRNLRNTIAHGHRSGPADKSAALLKDESELRTYLIALFKEFT